jgi:DtxR family Mn-dependent transcriptional regulator
MAEQTQALSESTQMYLINILRLAKDGEPVPLSQLAAALDVSPISANQMCRKLQDEGLVTYLPYKGVSITPPGQQIAARILRRHRLWEVFLVEQLHMHWEEAHDAACRMEHTTPDEVIERLDLFLEHPQVNPEGEPIPTSAGGFSRVCPRPLTEFDAGHRVHCIRCLADEAACGFLAAQGLRPGACFELVVAAPDALLLDVNGQRLTINRSLAAALLVEPSQESRTEGASQ